MEKEHVISDEVIEQAQFEISHGREWLAFNTITYFLDKGDMYFFKTKDEAIEFSDNNISEYDDYRVLNIKSIQDFLLQIPYGRFEEKELTNYLNKNLSIMNEKNLDYLTKQIKFTGFGEGHGDELKEKIQKQTPEFTLYHQQDFGKDNTVASLQFKRSEESDMYFFNRYNLVVKSESQPDAIKQTFYISNKEDNITLKEAYNLMSGRSVQKELANKEGEKYTAWLQLDFKAIDKNGNYEVKKFHQNYGFDLEKTLAKHPIKELSNEVDKGRLMDSLQRGNRQSVNFQHEGKDQKIYVEASPQFKSLNFYDGNMKRVNSQTINEKQGEGQTEKQEAKKEAIKKDKAGDDEGGDFTGQSQKRSRKKSQSVS